MKTRIIHWIKSQIKASGAKGIVFGLSGGIDSCVVAALAKQAVGRGKVLALMLPCHSHNQDLADARLIAKKLGIKKKIVDLSAVYDNLIKSLPAAGNLAKNNLKPRLRMLSLYYFANKYNYLVCGTGNKSELLMGYFTKYGDGGVDILPIANLLKKQVRQIARELRIPEHIILKPPTAGLWPGQTDEREMGITYNALDDILERIEHKRKQVVSAKMVNRVKRAIEKTKHKRRGPSVCCI